MTAISKLIDNFDGLSVDSTKWVATPGVGITQANGVITIPCTTSYPCIFSKNRYVLTESSVSVEIVQVSGPGNGSCSSLVQYIYDTSNKFRIDITNNTFAWGSTTNSVDNINYGTPYDAVNHRWVRMRETGSTLYVEASPNAQVWTVVGSIPTPAWMKDTASEIYLQAGYWSTETSPSPTIFDNFNVSPAVAVATLSGGITPPQEVLDAYLASTSRVVCRLEIYDPDGKTPWSGISFTKSRLVDGTVSVDYGRDERRTLDCTLDNTDGKLNYSSTGNAFWYDKVLKIYRGIELDDGSVWEIQLGEFFIDKIADQNSAGTISISGRDPTKKCLLDKFEANSEFSSAFYSAEILIKTLAIRAGIDPGKISVTSTTAYTDSYIFDPDKSMWECMTQVALDAQLDIYFDNFGVLQIGQFSDPTLSPPVFTFKTGRTKDASLVTYSRGTNDQSLFNSITVRGESSDGNKTPVWAVAQNTNPASPTSIARLGRRSTTYTSANVTTTEQAQEIANNFLVIASLEEFELSWTSLCFDWMTVGEIVEVFTDHDMPGSPTRYLLSSLSIPLKLGAMSGTGKRMTIA